MGDRISPPLILLESVFRNRESPCRSTTTYEMVDRRWTGAETLRTHDRIGYIRLQTAPQKAVIWDKIKSFHPRTALLTLSAPIGHMVSVCQSKASD
jgi:hypothetical protein